MGPDGVWGLASTASPFVRRWSVGAALPCSFAWAREISAPGAGAGDGCSSGAFGEKSDRWVVTSPNPVRVERSIVRARVRAWEGGGLC